MFELFIALFGGLYYGTKILGEKSAHNRIEAERNKRFSDMEADYKRWRAEMTDEDLHVDLHDGLQKNPEALFSEIVDDVNSLGLYPHISTYTDFFAAIYKSEFTSDWEYKIPIDMLMAKHGKIQSIHAISAIWSPGTLGQSGKEKWKRHHKFMLWLDKELQKHGAEPMLFLPTEKSGIFHNSPEKWEGIPIAEVVIPTQGRYFWRSGRMMAH